MRTPVLLVAVLLVTFVATEPVLAEPPVLVTLVKAGRLLDPRTGNLLAPAAVLIAGDRIKEVGPPSRLQASAPPAATIIDLGNATLLPGLIDSHAHLLLDVVPPAEAESVRRPNGDFVPGLLLAITMLPSERVLRGAQ